MATLRRIGQTALRTVCKYVISPIASNSFFLSSKEVGGALKKKEINSKALSRSEKKKALHEAYLDFDKEVRAFDLTKQILLLDEHTAALDPKTAKKVLELTDRIVKENQMTTLMITHNMKDAITYGDRLIMFHNGHVIFDVKGEAKKKLTVEELLKKFDEADKALIEG